MSREVKNEVIGWTIVVTIMIIITILVMFSKQVYSHSNKEQVDTSVDLPI